MSILIKGMKMPESCCDCEWHECYGGDYDWCHACRKTGTMPIAGADKKRANDCPLVEVPEPHGRLIDADALMNIFADRLVIVSERYGIYSAVAGAVSGAMKLLDVQPIVIEAEGE